MKSAKDCWYMYIVLCGDQTLYTGIAKNLEKRLEEHNGSSNGAKYTRARRPVRLVYTEEFSSRSEAAKREYLLKRMDRAAKLKLIQERVESL
jgi:putative endonuclease